MRSQIFVLTLFACALMMVVSEEDDTLFFTLWQRGIHHRTDSYLKQDSQLNPLLKGLPVLRHRGGDAGCDTSTTVCKDVSAASLKDLKRKLGPTFAEALAQNEEEHIRDCSKSCELFYCGEAKAASSKKKGEGYEYVSYPFGDVPPEDFASDFKYPLDLIKVTKTPLVSAEEALRVIKVAEKEGVLNGQYDSGKYRLGGQWLDNLPKTR